jgi:hypothetical protein
MRSLRSVEVCPVAVVVAALAALACFGAPGGEVSADEGSRRDVHDDDGSGGDAFMSTTKDRHLQPPEQRRHARIWATADPAVITHLFQVACSPIRARSIGWGTRNAE